MVRVAIILPPRDFRDETLSTAEQLFRKWDVQATVASYTSTECTGYHGAVRKPDVNAARITSADYDALLLVDGPGVDAYKLFDFRPLLDLVKHFKDANKLVAGVSNTVKVLARANIIADTRISAPKDEETQRLMRLYKGVPSNNPVEFDKNVASLGDPQRVDQLIDMLLQKLNVK